MVPPATAWAVCPVMQQQPLISATTLEAAKLASPLAGTALVEKGGDLTVLVINSPFLLLLFWTLATALWVSSTSDQRGCWISNLQTLWKFLEYWIQYIKETQKGRGIAAVFSGQHFYKALASVSLCWKGREFIFSVGYLASSHIMAGGILNCRTLLIF